MPARSWSRAALGFTGALTFPLLADPLCHVQRRRSVLHASIRSDRAQHRRPRRPTRRQRARPVRSAASAPARRPCARRRAGRRPRIPDRLRRRRRHVRGIDRRIVALGAQRAPTAAAVSTRVAIKQGFRFVRRHVWLWGDTCISGDRIPRVPRAHRSACSVSREERTSRLGGRPRDRLRGGRDRCNRSRCPDGTTRTTASRSHLHVRLLDSRYARSRRLWPRKLNRCACARLPRVQRT